MSTGISVWCMEDITETMLVDKVSPFIDNELDNKDIYVCQNFRECFIHAYANNSTQGRNEKYMGMKYLDRFFGGHIIANYQFQIHGRNFFQKTIDIDILILYNG